MFSGQEGVTAKKSLVIEATTKQYNRLVMMTSGKNEQSNGVVVMTPVTTLGKKVSESSMSEGVDILTTWMVGKKTLVIEAMAEQSNR